LTVKERAERRKRWGGGGKLRKPSEEGRGGRGRCKEMEVDGWGVPTPREDDILAFTTHL